VKVEGAMQHACWAWVCQTRITWGQGFFKESGVQEAWKGKQLLKIWPAKKHLVKWTITTKCTACAMGTMDGGNMCKTAHVGSAPV